jgi:GxxExxY protein
MDVLPEELSRITEKVIGCAFKVSNTLGIGFVEKVYENSLAYEIWKTKLQVKQQHPICVYYDQKLVGEFFADLLVEERILVELKVARSFDNTHMMQCLNYLRASGLPVCLLINFGRPKIEIKRILPSDVWKPAVYGHL